VRSSPVTSERGGGTAMSAALRPTSSASPPRAEATVGPARTHVMGGGEVCDKPLFTVAKMEALAHAASAPARNDATCSVMAWSCRNWRDELSMLSSPSPFSGISSQCPSPRGPFKPTCAKKSFIMAEVVVPPYESSFLCRLQAGVNPFPNAVSPCPRQLRMSIGFGPLQSPTLTAFHKLTSGAVARSPFGRNRDSLDLILLDCTPYKSRTPDVGRLDTPVVRRPPRIYIFVSIVNASVASLTPRRAAVTRAEVSCVDIYTYARLAARPY